MANAENIVTGGWQLEGDSSKQYPADPIATRAAFLSFFTEHYLTSVGQGGDGFTQSFKSTSYTPSLVS